MHPMLNIAIQAARNAGKTIVRYLDHLDASDVDQKARRDFVTKVDKLAEEEIIRVIRHSYPSHAILAEESGFKKGDSEFCWIIDPLDGTTNYIHGFPQFAVSIALKRKDSIEIALIYDPLRHELFTASRGQGAQLNNRRLRVSPCKKMELALLGTGFPCRDDQNLSFYLKTLSAIMPEASGVRRAGSAALDLAYVAAGRLDGFWETGLNTWDIAAGILLIREAGGIVTDFKNEANCFESGDILAATPKLHKPMLDLIQSAH